MVLMEDGDQSQPEGGDGPVHGKRGIQSKLSVTGEEVRDQPQPQAGDQEDVLLEDGDQPQPTKAGGGIHVDVDWDDEDDFENDTL